MRKYSIYVKFISTSEEFDKLHGTFTDIPTAIECALEFIEDINDMRKSIGVNKTLTSADWYILSDDERIFIYYDPLYKGYLITDFDNLDNIVVYVY